MISPDWAAACALLPLPGRPSLDGSPGVTRAVSVRLPEGLRRRALDAAQRRGTSLSRVVRDALEAHLGGGGAPDRDDDPPARRAAGPAALPPDLVVEEMLREAFARAYDDADRADRADGADRADRAAGPPGPGSLPHPGPLP